MEAAVEEIAVAHANLQSSWGKVLYRMALKVKAPKVKNRYQFELIAN